MGENINRQFTANYIQIFFKYESVQLRWYIHM